MAKLQITELEKTAVHEAGHVVADLHFGLHFEEVILSEDGSGEVSLLGGQRPSNLTDAKPYTIALFSGYAAEHVLLNEELTVEGGDWQQCRFSILPLFRSNRRFDAFTDKCLRAAVDLARLRSSEIRLLADDLIKHGRLTESAAKKILEQTKRCLFYKRTAE